MFLKKRHHADIMARLHSNNNSNSENSKETMEYSDDSGFSSDLIIDEEFEENLESKKIEPEEPEVDEDKTENNISERVTVIKHTGDLRKGMADEEEKGKEKLFNEGCCTKMNSIIEDCIYYDNQAKTCFCSNLVIGDHQVVIKIIPTERKEKQQKKKVKKADKDTRMRPFRCEEESCRKSYFKLSHLQAHIRVHTGERPFLCPADSCEATFARSDELSRHKRVHSGIKKFVCRYCDKAFMRSDHLSKHEGRHANLGSRLSLKMLKTNIIVH